MKNTLAENMLRFGVKNLSEASKRKLTEGPAKPIQPYAEVNPKSLKFADQATYDKFIATNLYKNIIIGYDDQEAAVAGKYGMWCLEKGNQFMTGPPSQYKLKSDSNDVLQIVAAEIANACVVEGRTVCGAFRNLQLAETLNRNVMQKLKNAGLYNNYTGGAASDGTLGYDMGLQGRYQKITQANWDYIFKEMEDTINKVIATYTVPVAAAAPAATAKPGTPAPAKKN
jgi:hypothetical protein